MVFGLGKKKDEDMEQLKEAIVNPNLPESNPMELEKVPRQIKSMAEQIEMAPLSEKPSFAPLFIKIDRYREVLREVKTLKERLVDVDNVLELRKQADNIKSDTDTLLKNIITELETSINKLNMEFVSPQAMGEIPKARSGETAKYVGELQDEIKKVKQRLENFR